MSNDESLSFSNPVASVSRYLAFSPPRSSTGAKSEFGRTVATNGESAFESARCSAASDPGVSDVTLLRPCATIGHSATRQSGWHRWRSRRNHDDIGVVSEVDVVSRKILLHGGE